MERRLAAVGPPPTGDRRRGRPRKYDEPAAASIRIRVTVAQRLDLERAAKDNGLDLTAAIREAVNEWVADYRESGPVFRGTQPAV